MKEESENTQIKDQGHEKESKNNTIVTFHIDGMTCQACANNIEKALISHPGTKEAEVDFARKQAIVKIEPAKTAPDDLMKVVEATGYIPLRGPDEKSTRMKKTVNIFYKRHYLYGSIAALSVVGFYLGLLTLTSDWYNARLEFKQYGLWIITLALGLGAQTTLFSFFRAWRRKGESMKAATCSLATSGGMSTTAMAACCAHYLAVLLPALGLSFLSTLAATLVQYQIYFLIVGIFSNLFGIGFMLRLMHRNGMIRIRFPVIHTLNRFQKVIR